MRQAWGLIGALLVTATAVAGLGPEVPLAPADNPGASQRNVNVAQASGHMLAVWSDGQLRGTLDGVPVDLASAGAPTAIIGVAAGSKTFLIAYQIQMTASPYYTPVLALRIGFDRRVLDPLPITVDADTHGVWGGNVAYDGSDFMIVTMEKHAYVSIIPAHSIVTGRVSEDGVVLGNLRLDASTSSGSPRWPRIAWASGQFAIGYAVEFFGSEGISAVGMSVLTMQAQESGSRLLSDSQFPNAGISSQQPAIAVGFDRVTLAWMDAPVNARVTINIAQTDLDGRPLLAPAVIAVVNGAIGSGRRVELVWDGQAYLVAWTPAGYQQTATIQALRLSYYGSPLDGYPFDIADGASGDFTLTALPPGFAIGYSQQNGTTLRAYMRTIDRAPYPQRRRAVR